MSVKPWFPTFIYDAALQRTGNGDLAQSLATACTDVRAHDEVGRAWCCENYPSGYTSYGTLRDLHRTRSAFVDLERKVWRHVKRFARQIDLDLREADLAMTECWVNIMTRDAVHPLHMHPGATISGTYYVRTPEGCSGIRFEDPRMEMSRAAPPRLPDCRPANLRRVGYVAEEGRVILFESWLMHEVVPNPSSSERISVSFNYTWV
jgi:uncharacterized protein (TIGR02466 family)